MTTIRYGDGKLRRNDKCPCGSTKKFKVCCSPDAPNSSRRQRIVRAGPIFTDTGEEAIRWVITDETTTKFFADKDNRALVFKSQAEAIAIAGLDEFHDQDPGEINVAGVGPTKWQLLQEKIPFVEIENIEHAVALIHERIEYGKAGELSESPPLELQKEQNGDCNTEIQPA